MAQKGALTYVTAGAPPSARQSNSVYYLATRTDVMQFYLFDEPKEDGSTTWTLIDQLDRRRLQGTGNKATAKIFAKRLGLTSWTYVKV